MKYLITGREYIKKFPDFELIGRDNELERLIAILMRGKSNSVILTGPGGSGCSALVLGLQKIKELPNAPFDIVAKRLFWLEVDEFFKSGKHEIIEKNFTTICDTLKRTADSILIIEDTRDFLEAIRGKYDNYINSLLSMVKNNQTQIIFEARDEDLNILYKTHSDINELFTLMDLPEPVNGDLPKILKNSARYLEKHHGIKIDDTAIMTAIELTNKYRTKDMGLSRAQPERSATLMDRALSSYRIDVHKKHPDIFKLEEDLKNTNDTNVIVDITNKINTLNNHYSKIQNELKDIIKTQRDSESAIFEIEHAIEDIKEEEKNKNTATKDSLKDFENFADTGLFESERVTELRKKIKEFQAIATDSKNKFETITNAINSKISLNSSIVSGEFAKISGIAVDKLNQDEKLKLKNLDSDIKTRIFGQNHAVDKLVDAIKVAKIGRRNGAKPEAAFLFLGPSGVGKTEIAKVLSHYLLDDENALTRFDMSEYMEKHSVAKLIGAPPGYEGFEVGGLLTNAMRINPRRILLFDEIEKAHPDVFNLFLQILSDGRLTDNVGRVVNFSDSIILMTTNIGQKFFLDNTLSPQEVDEKANEELNNTYRSEFLNRFSGRQNIVCFNVLDIESIKKIVKREFESINKAYESYNIKVIISENDMNHFCTDNYDPKIGARGLPGFIQSRMETIVVNKILDGKTNVNINVVYNRETHNFVIE